MVGDSEVDALSAENAKLPFILVKDGYTEKSENEIKQFIRNLREKKIPIHLINEENSSIEAKRIIKAKRQTGVIKKQKKEIIDSISAAIIAERWLNES